MELGTHSQEKKGRRGRTEERRWGGAMRDKGGGEADEMGGRWVLRMGRQKEGTGATVRSDANGGGLRGALAATGGAAAPAAVAERAAASRLRPWRTPRVHGAAAAAAATAASPPPPAVGGRRGGRPHQCAVTQPLPRRPRPRRAAAAVAAGVCRAADAGRAPFPPPPSSHSAAALAGLHPCGGATPAGAGRAQPPWGGRAGALDLGSIEPAGSGRRDAFCLRPPPPAQPPPPPPPGGQRRPPLEFSNARTPPPASRWPGAGHTADWRALTRIRGQPTRDTGWVEGTGGYVHTVGAVI